MNTPHFGTPLATFFATSRGQQALNALSAFTVIALALGEGPLSLVSTLIRIFGKGDRALGIEVPLFDQSIASLLGLVDEARGVELRAYLKAIAGDQGAVIQLSPEAMDLVAAGFADRPGVRYRCTVAMSPAPTLGNWARMTGHPLRASSLALFTALHHITAQVDRRYPCTPAQAAPGSQQAAVAEAVDQELARVFASVPTAKANDGIVPIRSQLWGELAWAGYGDHLDVLGHYRDVTPEPDPKLQHHDWLTSGSKFDDAQFSALMDAIASGILAS